MYYIATSYLKLRVQRPPPCSMLCTQYAGACITPCQKEYKRKGVIPYFKQLLIITSGNRATYVKGIVDNNNIRQQSNICERKDKRIAMISDDSTW